MLVGVDEPVGLVALQASRSEMSPDICQAIIRHRCGHGCRRAGYPGGNSACQDGDTANAGLRGTGVSVGLPGRFVPSVSTARAKSEGVATDGARIDVRGMRGRVAGTTARGRGGTGN
jgi:hypothetical protein